MGKVGQVVGQTRDKVGQTAEAVVSVPWTPRADDKRAILVSERATVFDRPAPAPAAPDPLQEITDPVWNHRAGRVWTPDLVHCRLLNVGDTIARLPSPLRRGYVSLLADVALDARDVEVRRPPTPAEITIADWTWSELLKRPATQRAILQAMAFGASVRSVSAMLARQQTAKVAKTTISRWYLEERRQLAAIWVKEKRPVDQATFDRWRQLFEKAEN